MSDMEEAPTLKGEKRDPSTGRFLKGTKGGPGNPHAKRVNRLRTVVLKAVTPDEMREVIAELITKAKCGDIAAIKLLFEYTLGKPKDQVEVEATGSPLVFNIVSAKKKRDEDDD